VPTPTDRLSRSVEDYLKAIYAIASRGDTATTSALAEALAVQPSSVTGMMKRLAEQGLVAHVPYRGVTLSELGRTEALRVIRRHRILETYLTEALGYAWEEVHDEAERLEHAASDRLIEAMAEALDDPSHDPHGAPIPTASGTIARSLFPSLGETELDVLVEVRSVRDKEADELRAMEALGLRPGVEVSVVARRADGGLSVTVGGDPVPREVDPEIAALVYVARVGAG
jgi:DtxR family Mn-dependent transcriptional regulator